MLSQRELIDSAYRYTLLKPHAHPLCRFNVSLRGEITHDEERLYLRDLLRKIVILPTPHEVDLIAREWR